MSSDQLPPELIAVALVIEASLSVAQDWRTVHSEYVPQILKRLNDSHPGSRLRVAVVSYGTADTVPSPVLCKRFFIDFQLVFKQLKEDPTQLGLAQVNAGGRRGTAALEGLVAALELFDILQVHSQAKETPNSKNNLYHIIHVAATSPDTSQYPTWNDSPALDDVDWETLPLELKKRNIQFNSIHLRPHISRFPDLHAASVVGGSLPWFNVRSPHSVLLAPFLTPPQQKGPPSKRPGEGQTVERTQDVKRPRLQPNAESPKGTPKNVSNLTTQSTTPVPSSSLPLSQKPVHNLPPQPIQPTQPAAHQNPNKISQMQERFRNADEQIRELEQKLGIARSEGRVEEAANLLQELVKHKDSYAKFKQAFSAYTQNQQLMAAKQQAQAQAHLASRAQNQATAQSQIAAAPFGLNGGNKALSSGGFPNPTSNIATNSVSQMQHSRSLSGTTFQPPTMMQNNTMPNTANTTGPQNLTLQMQKMIEQQQRLRPTQIGASHSMGALPPQMSTTSANNSEATMGSGYNAAPGPAPNSQQPSNMVAVWSGPLTWTGQGTLGKKEVTTYVVASTSNPAASHADTWPKTLSLMPTREPLVSAQDTQTWIKRWNPVICMLHVQPGGPDSKTNQQNYESLVEVLTIRKVFATAAWTTPSGVQANNVLFFPSSSKAIVGAFFPIAGIPEMPKASAPVPFNIPPMMLAQLQQMSQEQRETFMTKLALHRRQQLAQQQQVVNQQQHMLSQNQDAGGGVPFHPNTHPPDNHGNMNASMGMMANQGGPGMGVGPLPGLPPSPNNNVNVPGGVQGNLSYEMLQSFMQRNADGGVNMPQQG
ncbi:hypothetical protein B0H34DRAFT_731258 [Crassisporium funariophilum]|nr:hypothetical protein B0H34DRAFT_731258 [Crassisporium funariophilum]